MKPEVHILRQSSRFAPLVGQIEGAIDEVLAVIGEKITLPALDIVVADNPGAAIPETGVGGFAPTPHVIYISVDPEKEGLGENIAEEMKSTVAHETHHAARSTRILWQERTLLEAFVAEGLADHFDIEVNGNKPRPWSVALAEKEVQEQFNKAKESELFSKEADYSSWMFGSEERGIPRWTGYSIGFKLVGDYLRENSKAASQLVYESADTIVPPATRSSIRRKLLHRAQSNGSV